MPTAGRSTSCMSIPQLKERMPQWVGTVPYSHWVNRTWGYPTDCSGFTSWVLQMPRTIKAYEWGSDKFSKQIKYDDLRYGDIITEVKCKKGNNRTEADEADIDVLQIHEETTEGALPPIDYLPGHVFF